MNNTLPVHGISCVNNLTITEDALIVNLQDNKKVISLHHFTDRTPVARVKNNRDKNRANAGTEGEVAVLRTLLNNGVKKEDIFPSAKVLTKTGHQELWDGAFKINGHLILLQTKTRLLAKDEESQRDWMRSAAKHARKQVRSSNELLKNRPTLRVKNMAGKYVTLRFSDYDLRYLTVLAVNSLLPARPGRFTVDNPPDMPYPGSTITFKELKDLFALFEPEEAFEYLTEQSVISPQNLGFELVRYAHKLKLRPNETLVLT